MAGITVVVTGLEATGEFTTVTADGNGAIIVVAGHEATSGLGTAIAEMRYDEVPIADTVAVSDSTIEVTYFDKLLDSLGVSDTLAQSQEDRVTEILEAEDFFGADTTVSSLADSATISDTITPSTAIADRLDDTATIYDYALNVLHDAVIETIAITDTITEYFLESVEDSVTVQDDVTDSRATSDSLVSSATVNDVVVTAAADAVTETATLADILLGGNLLQDALYETASLSDSVSDLIGFRDTLYDSATVSDSLTFAGSTVADSVLETVTAKDTLYARDYGALAWVVNTETGAPSFYDNFEFTSILEHRGLLLASSAEGLFLLGRAGDDTDNGIKVRSEVVTGLLDWNSDRLKYLRSLYLGYTGGQLDLEVETYNQPVPRYYYELAERDADAPRNNRIRTGRGLKSRFWRFTIKNVSGEWHQIYDMSAIVDISNRRL